MNRRPTFVIPISRSRTYLRLELLEARDVPSSTSSPLQSADVQSTVLEAVDDWFSPNHLGDNRIDANTVDSPYAGVGSILVTTDRSSFIGSAAAIGPRHVLTAAHIIDLNNDGKVNQRDKATGTYFVLNYGEDQSHRIAIEKIDIQPDFTGFNRPSVNDDLAILTLSEDLPEGVPIYPIANFDLSQGTVVTMVGYGRSGDGVNGYDTSASLTVKRVGQNIVDAFYTQDDRKQPPLNEVFRFDFDSPEGNGPLGGSSVPLETQLGQGDSGGPSFISTGNGLTIVGVNTFIQGAKAPKYGSMGGGINVFAYQDFINSVLNPGSSPEASEALPSGVVPLVPGVTPLGGLPVSRAIRIGAKAVSAEFAISNWNSLPNAERLNQSEVNAFDVTVKSGVSITSIEPNTVTRARSIESASLNPLLAGFESARIGSFVSIDAGLLAIATGEVLSVE